MGEKVRIEDLSTEERLALLERIWDSLTRTPGKIPLVAAQRQELDRRSAAFEGKGAATFGVPWDEVLRQLRARR